MMPSQTWTLFIVEKAYSDGRKNKLAGPESPHRALPRLLSGDFSALRVIWRLVLLRVLPVLRASPAVANIVPALSAPFISLRPFIFEFLLQFGMDYRLLLALFVVLLCCSGTWTRTCFAVCFRYKINAFSCFQAARFFAGNRFKD